VTNVPLMEAYPRLYSLVDSQDGVVSAICERNAEGGLWRLCWRRELFEWEKELLNSLLERLNGVVRRDGDDVWVWKPGIDGVFFR
jgi:hypothetical protein